MPLQITPDQQAQLNEYTKQERQFRLLLANGLNLQLEALRTIQQLEQALLPGGQLEEIAQFYKNQYKRFGDADAAKAALGKVRANIEENHKLMWQMHSLLKQRDTTTDLFPGITPILPDESPDEPTE